MKKLLLALFTLILSVNSSAQINFEKGYFINNSGEKTECLIKNIDWKNNPTEFLYKLLENDTPKTATIEMVKEFGVNNISKYSRANVNIDRSSEMADKLSTNKSPVFNEEQLFLKTLVEGKANLYYYEDGNLTRFFVSNDSSKIEQLIFKSYIGEGITIHENNHFRQQLLNSLQCNTISKNDLKNINYKKKELTKLFVKYNKCSNSGFTEFEKKQERDKFNLNIRPGINFSSMSVYNTSSRRNFDFDSELSFRIGIEAEFILPFNKNKWALIVEPNYQYYKSEIEFETQTITADYHTIQIPFGLRHYFFLNNYSKIFLNSAIALDFSGDSKIERNDRTLYEIEKGNNMSFGVGYNHNGKYSLEFRYLPTREIIKNYGYVDSEYKRVSLIFGYNIF